MFTHSIRWRLQSWLAFLLVCVLTGFGVTVYQLQRINQLKQIDDELESRVAALNLAVRGRGPFDPGRARQPFDRNNGPEFQPDFRGEHRQRDSFDRPGPEQPFPTSTNRSREPFGRPPGFFWPGPREVKLSPEVAALFNESSPDGFYFAIWGRDGKLIKQSTNAPASLRLPAHLNNDTRIHVQMQDTFREAFQYTELGDSILTGRSIARDLQARGRFGIMLLAAGAGVLALGLGVGWILSTRAIRPVEQISAAARRISAGNLSERIQVADPRNELGQLATVLNSTFSRLDRAFCLQRQFTADAAHELRTPLAVIISETQTTLARERSAAEYRETVQACLDTAQQMRQLAESLLELARFDAGQEDLQKETVNLAELSRVCIDRVQPLAECTGIVIETDLQPGAALANPQRLSQVIVNLLVNAVHYNHPRGKVLLRTGSDASAVFFAISDTGPGIAAEELPHLFERFYRADKSRSRSEGHSGLGLAICKAIIDAHGGTIEISSQVNVGTIVTVRLPKPAPAA